jgi:hypothetical protein
VPSVLLATKKEKTEDEMIAFKSAAFSASLLVSSAALADEAKITVLYGRGATARAHLHRRHRLRLFNRTLPKTVTGATGQ